MRRRSPKIERHVENDVLSTRSSGANRCATSVVHYYDGTKWFVSDENRSENTIKRTRIKYTATESRDSYVCTDGRDGARGRPSLYVCPANHVLYFDTTRTKKKTEHAHIRMSTYESIITPRNDVLCKCIRDDVDRCEKYFFIRYVGQRILLRRSYNDRNVRVFLFFFLRR